MIISLFLQPVEILNRGKNKIQKNLQIWINYNLFSNFFYVDLNIDIRLRI